MRKTNWEKESRKIWKFKIHNLWLWNVEKESANNKGEKSKNLSIKIFKDCCLTRMTFKAQALITPKDFGKFVAKKAESILQRIQKV